MKKKLLNLNDPKVRESVERRIIDKMIIKANKKKDKKEIIMPMKFNVGLQKYEPDLKKLKFFIRLQNFNFFTEDKMPEKQILKWRKEINYIDNEIFSLLKKRFQISRKIGNYKKRKNLKILDIKRENDLIKKAVRKSKLPKNFINSLYNLIFNESWRIQNA